jgi:cytochrome c-type biogenesis protein CcmH/NrfG
VNWFRHSALLFCLLLVPALVFAAPDDPPAPDRLLTSGHPEAAIAALQARLQANPKSAGDASLLSRAYLSAQKWDDAITAGERAISLAPDVSDYHLWLGRAYGEKADHISALNIIGAYRLARKTRNEFERAVALQPDNVAALSDVAEFYFEAPGWLGGGIDKAQAVADKLARLSPPTSHWIRAHIAEKKKNYAEAEAQYRAAIEAAPEKPPYWLNLAHFLEKRGQLDQMQQAILQGSNTPGFEGQVLYDAAEMLFRAGRNFPAAVDWLRRYITGASHTEGAPVFAAHYLLGSILEKQGDRVAAAEQFRASLALLPDFSPAQDALQRVSQK